MRLLVKLTLGYVAVLVPTLAGSLIAILVYLRRISGTLGEVQAGLAKVSEQTAPLNATLGTVQQVTTATADQMAQARTSLQHAEEGTEPGGEAAATA